MAMHTKKFGYFPRSINLQIGSISISDLSDLDQTISDVEQSEYVEKDWIYAPPASRTILGHEGIALQPYTSRVFGLPKTHNIAQSSGDNEEHLDFLIWSFGFFTGMRLTATEAGFVDATPIKPNKLNDFVLSNCTFEDAVELSETFWQKHKADPRMPKRMTGAIHALFLAQYPQNLSYERFIYLYTALDACFAMLCKLRPNATAPKHHASRIEWMCQQFGMEVPSWASAQLVRSEVSVVRNDTIHEALFFEEPLGFAIYGGNQSRSTRNVELEMEALVCRLLVGIFGKHDSEYVKSQVNTRQRHGLKL